MLNDIVITHNYLNNTTLIAHAKDLYILHLITTFANPTE